MESQILVAIIAGGSAVIGGVLSGVFSILLQHLKHKDEQEDNRDEWKNYVNECLDKDKKRLDSIEETDKLILRALMALLGHSEDGNHTGELSARRQDIEQYLIER